MNTDYDAAKQQKKKRQAQRRRALRRKWWRRRLSLLILALAILCAIIACIVALVHARRSNSAEAAEETVSAEEFEETEPIEEIAETEDAVESEDAAPQSYLSESEVSFPGNLVLVNSSTIWSGTGTGSLVRVYDEKNSCYGVRDSETLLDRTVIEPLNRMMEDFTAATGNEDIVIAVGYRSVEEQQTLWDNSVEIYGEEYTAGYYDAPGTSEHHTGLAFDLSFTSADGQTYTFDGTGDSEWIVEHCWEYGFVLRYPEDKASVTGNADEPWHFRYVGTVHASVMQENNLCLEEYLDYLQQFTYDGERLETTLDGADYEIWYSTDLRCDEDGSYTVSSDNRGGYIITKQCD